ncbi:uncharacterized protein LOC113681427, partial [Pocillopora damicornis]|uniref:uncharacterized protein LOC113681427 n=1 Tax=Pocillopora damicornis TaxID=46731 RepID=UPI000F556C3A
QEDTLTSQSTATKLAAFTAVTVCLVGLIKWHFGGGVCKSKARLDGKTVIVTGANTGIGKETASDLARRGAKVILACRDEQRATDAAKDIIAETGSDKVHVRIVDLSSFESVRAFAKLINETEERLDILVNNAGLGEYYRLTEDGYESVFQVNYLSHFLLTLLLLDKMKKSAPSRIVNVSSQAHEGRNAELQLEDFKLSEEKFDAFQRYAQSKLAQVVFTKELSRRLEGTGVTVYALHPGVVSSDIWRNLEVLKKPYIRPFVMLVMFLFFKDCKQGAQTSIYCSVAEELEGVSGLYYSDCKVKEVNKLAKDPGLAKKLWDVSERITGESWKDYWSLDRLCSDRPVCSLVLPSGVLTLEMDNSLKGPRCNKVSGNKTIVTFITRASVKTRMAAKLLVAVVFLWLSCCVLVTFSENIDKGGTQGESLDPQTIISRLLVFTAVTVCLVVLTKWYFGGGVCRSKARLDGKTVIVTGANTGIGKETASDLARRGAKVILACRDEQRATDAAKDIIAETGSDKVLVRILDLNSFESVRAFAKLISETEERLDILVNNAGIGLGAPYRLTKDGYESVFQVNYLSHFLLTLLLLDKMKKSAPSRIVNVSSLAHEQKIATLQLEDFKLSKEKFDKGFGRYAQSKLAQVVFTKELSRRLEGTGVTVYALHPGGVNSDIWRNYKFLENPFLKPFVTLIAYLFLKDCKQGAQTSIYCSVAEELEGVSGLYFSDCKVREGNKLAKDPGLAKKLWDVSERITGESWKD